MRADKLRHLSVAADVAVRMRRGSFAAEPSGGRLAPCHCLHLDLLICTTLRSIQAGKKSYNSRPATEKTRLGPFLLPCAPYSLKSESMSTGPAPREFQRRLLSWFAENA